MKNNQGLRILILPSSNKIHVGDSLYELELHPSTENDLLKIQVGTEQHELPIEHVVEKSPGTSYIIPTKVLLDTTTDETYPQAFKDQFSARDIKLFKGALQIINDEISDLPTIEALSRRVGLNQNKLQLAFKLAKSCSINEYVKQKRLELAVYYLENTEHNMSEITALIGLTSRSYFAKTFQEHYNIKPSAYRRLQRQNIVIHNTL